MQLQNNPQQQHVLEHQILKEIIYENEKETDQ